MEKFFDIEMLLSITNQARKNELLENKEFINKIVVSYLNILPKLKNFGVSNDVEKYLRNYLNNSSIYDTEELVNYLSNISKFSRFLTLRNATTEFLYILKTIYTHDGKISLKNAYLEGTNLTKSEVNEQLNVILANSYQLTLYYKYILISESIRRLKIYDNLVENEVFIELLDEINKLNMDNNPDFTPLNSSQFISIIRNGFAHESLVDGLQTDIHSIDELKDMTAVKVTNKEKTNSLVLLDYHIEELFKMIRVCALLNLRETSYMDKRKSPYERIKNFIESEYLEDFEREIAQNLLERSPNFSQENCTFQLICIKYPPFGNCLYMNLVSNYIANELNVGRNKTNNDAKKAREAIVLSVPFMLFKQLSLLQNLGQIKTFIDTYESEQKFLKIPTIINPEKKRKSKIRILNLMRNSLAHGNYILTKNNNYVMFDIDENKEKFKIGQYDIIEMLTLIDLIDEFIFDYYLQEINNTIPTSITPNQAKEI
ncbi:MAG TPA: hypothetical protein IAB72_05060 [Candidatus Onthoplasma faecipullorum]|nr:hypothetical protein [Candidatus Onthoplasma faecipullorum]